MYDSLLTFGENRSDIGGILTRMQLYSLPDLLKLSGIVTLYLVAAQFVLSFFGGNDLVLYVWIALGPSTAAIFVGGNRLLPGILVGTLLGFLMTGQDFLTALYGSVRHTAVVAAGVWLLRRDGRFNPALDSLADYLRVLGVACALGFLGAGLTEILALIGSIPGNFTFLQFFAGAMLSTLIGVPFFLVWRSWPQHWTNRQSTLAALVILGISFLVGQIVFLDWMKDTVGQIARGYWMFLFVTWAAVRLGPHGAVLVIAMTAIQGLVGAQYGTGFFSNDIAKTHLSNYFFYTFCLSAVGMALASYFAERQKVMKALDAKLAELDRANAELARKNEEMESMIYITSHDLRSPLVNIQGFGQRLEKAARDISQRLAREDVPESVRAELAKVLKERIPSALDFIKSSSLKMDNLINGLLRLSRVGRTTLAIQPIDMNALLAEIRSNLTIQTQQADATVTIAPLPACLGDPDQINQVFTNLIDNAIKYRDPARPLAISVTGALDGEIARYAVTDTGRGIEKDFQPMIWQLFHRLDPNGPVTGEGLGLTLVRRIVDRHDGHISLNSQPGVGSCFTVELPAA